MPIQGHAEGARLDPVAARGDRQYAASSSAIHLQERERARIGFDLHDGPAQSLSAALLQVRMLEDMDHDEYPSALHELRETIAAALQQMYDIIHDLGTRIADGCDLVAGLEELAGRFSDSTGVGVDVAADGDPSVASESLRIALFRIVQESLSNVRRHAGADRVAVRIRFTHTEALCTVVDDGCGFDTGGLDEGLGGREILGLYGMAERARLLGGECTVSSRPGAGTRVAVRIPL